MEKGEGREPNTRDQGRRRFIKKIRRLTPKLTATEHYQEFFAIRKVTYNDMLGALTGRDLRNIRVNIAKEQENGDLGGSKDQFRVRLDIAKDYLGVNENVRVFTSGHILREIEAILSLGMAMQSAAFVFRVGLSGRGIKLQPAFTKVSTVDNRTVTRYWREEDVENWLDFTAFMRYYVLAGETAALVADLNDASRGMILYHLWLEANKTGDWREENQRRLSLRDADTLEIREIPHTPKPIKVRRQTIN